MKSPTTKDSEELKRVGRYLRGRPVGAIVFEPQTLPGALKVFCDTDPAGDLGTRKSRSGMAVMWSAHLIKHGSAVQSTIALSSGESEYYALLRSSAHALGIKAMLNGWHYGVECEIHRRCVGSAARGMSARRGLGKTRHVDVRFLWLQQAVQEGRLKVLSLPTSENLSDTFTKSLFQVDVDRCLVGNVGSGRHRKLENT